MGWEGSIGSLHFANVSVGTPPLWFLVALDTGSDLFWLPCDCISCVHGGLRTRTGKVYIFIFYRNHVSLFLYYYVPIGKSKDLM